VLPVVAPPQHAAIVVQLVGNGRTVDLHRGGEHDQLVPLRHLKELEKVSIESKAELDTRYGGLRCPH